MRWVKTCLTSGSALIMSLVFIILLSVVVVGFVTTAGLERKTVESYYAKAQATFYASMAVDITASRIKEATKEEHWWISQPGRVVYKNRENEESEMEFVDLSSGMAEDIVKDLSVNLNPPGLISERGLILSDAEVEMPVKWVYVRQDGTHVFGSDILPDYDAANPLVGRYAFWTDDLSGRINLNTATSSLTPEEEPVAHPSRLGLQAIPDLQTADIEKMREYRQEHLYASVEHAKAAQPNNTDFHQVVENHKMDLTHYNHSPDDLNVFGDSRIVLTTKIERANGRPFFDILTTAGSDPGVNANISAAKFNALFEKLYTYLKRADWPMEEGKSFVDKYGARGAAQIVLNLIDYVRSAEAEEVIVEASRGSFNPATEVFAWGSGVAGGNGMMGNARRLLITQMGVWMSESRTYHYNGENYFDMRFRTEVYLPESVGDADTEVNLREGNRHMYNEVNMPGINKKVFNNLNFGGTNFQIISSFGNIAGGNGSQANRAKMYPGQYRTITMRFPAVQMAVGDSRPAGTVYLRSTIRVANNPSVGADIVPILQDSSGSGQAAYNLDSVGVAPDQVTAIFVDDPVINKSRFDWGSQGASTFGNSTRTSSLASTLGDPRGTLLPQQDTDADDKLTDEGFGFPAWKGTSRNLNGRVESLVELGRVHTGGQGTGVAGIAWRTLRLQPRDASDESLPDWFLLNLFIVPQDTASSVPPKEKAVLYPQTGSVGGRVNVNARLYPFSEMSEPVIRWVPLSAVLQSAGSEASEEQAGIVAENIADGKLADGKNEGRFYGETSFQDAKIYFLPEQVVEIEGVTDEGEQSEEHLKEWLPHLTVRGSVFSVFSVGQKIRQLPNNTIVVQAESRTETMLERKENNIVIISTREIGL